MFVMTTEETAKYRRQIEARLRPFLPTQEEIDRVMLVVKQAFKDGSSAGYDAAREGVRRFLNSPHMGA